MHIVAYVFGAAVGVFGVFAFHPFGAFLGCAQAGHQIEVYQTRAHRNSAERCQCAAFVYCHRCCFGADIHKCCSEFLVVGCEDEIACRLGVYYIFYLRSERSGEFYTFEILYRLPGAGNHKEFGAQAVAVSSYGLCRGGVVDRIAARNSFDNVLFGFEVLFSLEDKTLDVLAGNFAFVRELGRCLCAFAGEGATANRQGEGAYAAFANGGRSLEPGDDVVDGR